ncbi:MAG TPA: alpha-amylase family glycosyl hydrolase, partial [Chryseosolibacter sp.]|nr:alpha-amylase family glycosyl hydrolase [Chryseosolibacter sp.]
MTARTTLFAFIVCVLLNGCENRKNEGVVQWPHGVKYEVFVMSFADGDGNGKGDFRGLTSKLDYFTDLGVNGLWLMPIMPSDTYHKYHVIDYKNIDPDFGTLEDFRKFVGESHKRGIRIITDFVINHTGNLHPWFLEASKGPDNPYRDYYVWARKDSIRDQIGKRERALDSDNIRKWHAVNGDTLGEHYYGYFNSLTPDLNLDNPKVRQEIIDIARFWLNDLKVDGFRMDAARHIFPDERMKDNHEFWVWFRKEMETIKPDVYLVGEVWSSADVVAPYLKGLPSLFNFDLGYAITDVARAGRDTIGLVKRYKEIRDYYKSITNEYLDATFVKNHDQTRLLTELKGDINRSKMAAALLLTMPGTPYLYYGEEIGMVGDKLQVFADIFGPDAYVREPFIWDYGRNDKLQTAWEKPQYSTDSTVVPFSKQKDDASSLFNFYKRLIQFRNSSKPLTYGDIDHAGIDIAEVVAFRRIYDGEQALVLHNVSDVEVTITLPEGSGQFKDVIYDMNGTSKLQDGELTLPAFTTVVM